MKNLYVLITVSIVTFYSTLNAQWIHSNGAYGEVHSLAFSDTNLFAGNVGGNIFRSTDNGASWTVVFSGIYVDALATSDTNIFAGTGGGVYRSTNNGATWTVSGLTNVSPQAFAISDTNLFAGTFQSGVYRSTNNGSSWTAINNGLQGNALKITALFVSDTNLFAGTWGGGVFLSTNNGLSWTEVSEGLTNNVVNALIVYDTYLFAGTDDGVWRRPMSEMITTGVEDQSNEIPSHFILKQNYPNPFNPSTTIRYSVPSSEFVTLKVYDVLGNVVATLVNEEKTAGSYEAEFNAAGLSSGIYFNKLQTRSFVETKKMLLLK